MYVNNLIHSSDFVTLVPMGMPTTLEFNEIGNLKKVYWGFGDNKKDVSAEIFSAAKVTDEIKPFPFKINITFILELQNNLLFDFSYQSHYCIPC